jgi:hypothetical protein
MAVLLNRIINPDLAAGHKQKSHGTPWLRWKNNIEPRWRESQNQSLARMAMSLLALSQPNISVLFCYFLTPATPVTNQGFDLFKRTDYIRFWF